MRGKARNFIKTNSVRNITVRLNATNKCPKGTSVVFKAASVWEIYALMSQAFLRLGFILSLEIGELVIIACIIRRFEKNM